MLTTSGRLKKPLNLSKKINLRFLTGLIFKKKLYYDIVTRTRLYLVV